ncbi:MAG: flagellar protein FliS [Defluviitaleaceae bacterium]|nr:flagellar protein FliS [Defluviitaleaceae bacterium]
MNIDDYKLRIAQATPLQLVIINYEMAIGYIDEALKNEDGFERGISKARESLFLLTSSLDLKISVAQDLYTVYEYIGRLLTSALFGKGARRAKAAADSKSMLEELLEGWLTVNESEAGATSAEANAPQVFAGLTYTRGGELSEYVNQNENRGYKA